MNPSIGPVRDMPLDVQLDGEPVPARAWWAEAPRAVVAVVHGLGEHSGRYAALAGDLVAAGYAVAALDLPGHGAAPGPRGHVPSWDDMRDGWVSALIESARKLPGAGAGLPVFLLGHSMGGAIALDFALAHPGGLAGIVASAPALRSAPPPRWKLALGHLAHAVAPSLGIAAGLDESAMSRDPEVIKGRAEDPLVHQRISPRLYFAFDEARRRVLRDAGRLGLPALVLAGGADRVVDPAGAAEFAAAAPPGRATLITYPAAYHEIFNDHDRAQVIADMLAWMERTLPAVARPQASRLEPRAAT
jgi:alpha-beta hydrolase superfamily lysophospholipase